MSEAKLGRDVFVALAAIGWADGKLDDEEADAIVRTAVEEGLTIEETTDDPVAESAQGGTLRTVVEGNLVTVSVATSQAEVERLRAAYARGEPGARLDVRGRYVVLWLRDPSRSQRQATYDCAY